MCIETQEMFRRSKPSFYSFLLSNVEPIMKQKFQSMLSYRFLSISSALEGALRDSKGNPVVRELPSEMYPVQRIF